MLESLKKVLVLPIATAIVICGALLLAACSGQSDDTAASCDSFAITEQQVSDYTTLFRAQNNLSDDATWGAYLKAQGLEAKDWRDEAIRALAQRELIEQKASELKVSPDTVAIEQMLMSAKAARGSAQAWQDTLSSKGITEEQLRDQYSYISVQQQVLVKELGVNGSDSADAVNSYIEETLLDRVTRRYEVASFASEQEAKDALLELGELEGDALARRFGELADTQSKATPAAYSGDLGWDLAYDTSSFLEGDDNLKLQPNNLYQKAKAGDDGTWKIYLCTGRFAFEKGCTAADVTDEALKSLIEQAVISSSEKAAETQDYLSKLVDDAQVQVRQMPAGLPYDVAKQS